MDKTKKMMTGVLAAALATSMTACGQDRPPKPTGYDCDDWDWDKETRTYYCDDDSSSYYRSYYHGGTFYSSKNKLKSSSGYKSYYSQYKAGIGSGTKGGFGG
ncbi:hypothetical protein ACFOU2_23025 [Bacillus songklensis]|uniref:Lipoprotein n=1 Tax=Bacillus songklensis TaxID=1069116 RepID=A0ABV8B7G2_9BACI